MRYTIIFTLSLTILIGCDNKPAKEIESPDQAQATKYPLPAVPIKSLDNDTIMLNEVGLDKDFIVVLFESGCDFCHKEAKSMDSIATEFKGIPVFFLSSDPLDVIEEYKNQYFQSDVDEFVFGSIDLQHMKVLADNEPIFPTIMWFGKNGGLKVRNRGFIDPDRIIRTIKQ